MSKEERVRNLVSNMPALHVMTHGTKDQGLALLGASNPSLADSLNLVSEVQPISKFPKKQQEILKMIKLDEDFDTKSQKLSAMGKKAQEGGSFGDDVSSVLGVIGKTALHLAPIIAPIVASAL